MVLTQLRERLKVAMKEKDTAVKSALQVLISAIMIGEKEKKAPLTEQEELAFIQREIKQTKDPIDDYKRGGRQDLVDEAIKKIEMLEEYLPKQLSKEEIIAEITELLGKNVVVKHKGAVMKIMMPILKGKAEGKLINEAVDEFVASLKQ